LAKSGLSDEEITELGDHLQEALDALNAALKKWGDTWMKLPVCPIIIIPPGGPCGLDPVDG
jgi:hypothetical protein